MKRFFDFIGSFFVYKSPEPYQGFARFLETLPSRELKALAETQAHYSKKRLVQIYLLKNNYDNKFNNSKIQTK
jgi:predicted glycosyltransferase involved in capsule biosynthesis|tara:strand:- start:336 stop:554 length:219 start_codon:yes stop_codon:yes gene_type:complete